ncbi:MAG: universal stress protein [Methylocystis sp.]|jgi:nucleotide-binding universal stress UspA family protein|nr:universal stress protein [Methylocystis sp.]MCA3585076.1 universal stress protein [Methylocystis sp.]MCA3587793.1 universal stress protein [Methylocystis sp.]MCA3592294.1 universal stress protein [Methylocystis sp.]
MLKTKAKKPVLAGAESFPHHFQDILVYQDESQAAANALRYAQAIVAPNDGHVAGLMFGFMSPYPASVYMEASPDLWAAEQQRAVQEADAVEQKLKAKIAAAAPGTELRRKDVFGAEVGRVLAVHGRYADAIILGWSQKGRQKDLTRDGTALERDIFDSILFESGRPVILVPEAFAAVGPPGRILVAWSPEREATRAVHEALPLLQGAELVTILAVAEGTRIHGEEDAGADIARHLARHGVKTEVKHVPSSGRTAQAVIKDEARYAGAELIVMGGYGHSRLSQWILGGVTRDMLADLTAPVFMSH